MKNSILKLVTALIVLAPQAQASVDCSIIVPSDLSQPMNYDKVLWKGAFDSTDLYFRVAKDLSSATSITEKQAWDKELLAKHNGEFIVAIGRPYPGDQEPGDFEIALSTIDMTQKSYRNARVMTVANISLKPDSYGLVLNDLTRHISASCR